MLLSCRETVEAVNNSSLQISVFFVISGWQVWVEHVKFHEYVTSLHHPQWSSSIMMIITGWRHWAVLVLQVAPSSGLTTGVFIQTQTSIWRRWQRTLCHGQALISRPCDQHLLDSLQKPLGFTPKACFVAEKNRSINFPTTPWDFL